MATGLAIGVTVIGIAAILALLGILARQLGFWAWAVNWLKATSEEKTKLCRPERVPATNTGRPYLTNFQYRQQMDNELDWINLWPRSGSYKRFSNLDDVNNEEAARINSNMIVDPPIPPQPLRPAPGPPHNRMPLRYDTNERSSSFGFPGSGMLMGMMKWDNRAMHHYNGLDRSMPLLDRRDSDRSLNRKNLAQDYQPDMLTSSLPRKASSNPFRSGLNHASSMYTTGTANHYSNPFSPNYQYQTTPRHFQAIEEDNRVNHTLVDDRMRHGYHHPDQISRSEHHIYANNYDEYSRLAPIHNQSLDRGIDRLHGAVPPSNPALNRAPDRLTNYNNYATERPPVVQNSSQLAYSHSLNQALAKQRKLQQDIQQQLYINRYDKIKQDEERIKEEERILHQLRYENDLLRRENFENSIQSNGTYNFNGINSNIYDIEETRELEREAIRENIVYNLQKGASDIREEFEKRFTPKMGKEFDPRATMIYDVTHATTRDDPPPYDINNYATNHDTNRDSPPPPAPDQGSNTSYPDSPETPPKSPFSDWKDSSNVGGSLEIPATPPNTASLTPPNVSSLSSDIDPYSNEILHTRLAQVEDRYKDSESDDQMKDVRNTINATLKRNLNNKEQNISDDMYPNVFMDSRDDNDIGGELTQKLHALQEGKGIDIYPRALKERIEKRREREGSRRKKKRERDLERRSSFKQLNESKVNEAIEAKNKINQNIEVSNISADNKDENIPDDIRNGRFESALNNVPIGLVSSSLITDNVESIANDTSDAHDEQSNVLSVANVTNRNLVDSPVVPRKSFLSYRGSWDLDANSNDDSDNTQEEDANTKRVREYIASLSARLQQLPDKEEENKMSEENTSSIIAPPSNISPLAVDSSQPPTTVSFPMTPPNSARTNSQSSIDTPSSSAATWGSVHAWRLSSETPPSSAGFTGENTRPSYSDTPPNSVSLNNLIDTPPHSAEYPGTPHNSGEINGGSFDCSSGSDAAPIISRPPLKRAMSCDSVSSDTSITMGELEEEGGQVTGQLTVQVTYDCDTADLEVLVMEGKDLIGPDANVPVDSYVRVFLLPDKTTNMQTRACKRTNNPSFRERFLFALEEEEVIDRCLVFYMYATDKFTNTLIGEAQLKLGELDLRNTTTSELTLVDSGPKGPGFGEIMFSLSYLPTAERLTVVVVKGRSLKFSGDKLSGDPFVKVYILQNGKKMLKKKTIVKKDTNSPLFNEAMSFNISLQSLNTIQLRLTVAEYVGEGSSMTSQTVGHVIVGTQATGKALSHWNQMMSSLRKPIGMWHALRR